MDILLVIIAFLLFIIGLIGCIVPFIPGPPISYIGILMIHWSGFDKYSAEFLVILAVITLLVTVLDFYLPVWATKRFGGSRYATVGTVAGLIAGVFVFPPVGIIICPFIGALIGQLLYDGDNAGKAVKVALGSFVAFMLGTGLKLIVSGAMLFFGVLSVLFDSPFSQG